MSMYASFRIHYSVAQASQISQILTDRSILLWIKYESPAFLYSEPCSVVALVISLFARKNVYGAYIYILSPIWLITAKCLWAKSVQWHWNKIMHQRWRSYQTCVNFLSGRFSPYPLNSICLIFLTCKEPFHEG